MFEEMGIATGVNVEGLVEASKAAQDLLGRPLGSHVLTAGPVDWSGPESVPRA
jgi:hydroxymethylglutaryl-CoA lyase